MALMTDALVQQLLQRRYVATLATRNPDGSAHLTAVWYWFDGKDLYVATHSGSKKARNARAYPRASLMIDSRAPQASFGATIVAEVAMLEGERARALNERVHARYLSERALADTRLGPVFANYDDVTLQLRPTSVFTWDMREADRMFFNGAFSENPDYLLNLGR